MSFKDFLTESSTIKNVFHGGAKGIKELRPDKTKSMIFGDAVYFTDNLESAKRYAIEKYGDEYQIYSADITITNDAKHPMKFKKDKSFDGFSMKLSNNNETNYGVRNSSQIKNLKKITQ
jgi:hypothetical protein